MHIYVLMFKGQMRTSSIMLCYYSSCSLGRGSLNEPGTRLADKPMQFFQASNKIPGLYVVMVRFLGGYQGFEHGSLSLLSNCPYPPSNLQSKFEKLFSWTILILKDHHWLCTYLAFFKLLCSLSHVISETKHSLHRAPIGKRSLSFSITFLRKVW